MKDNYGDKSYGGESQGDCSGWYASHDHRPPGPKKLHVTGKCTFPTGGYSVKLKPAVPQGTVAEIYLLEKIVTKPTGGATTAITTVDVRYDEETDTEYKQVQIRPDNVTIDVEHTE